MPVKLLLHVVQEMRSLSNIIKSGRIRSQSFLDLSQRPISEIVEKVYEEKSNISIEIPDTDRMAELIHKRKEELALVEEEIQKKREDADNKIKELLANAHIESEKILNEANAQKAMLLEEAHQKQAEILQLAQGEAENIKALAQEEKKALLESTEDEVVDTMLVLLKHIISEELNHNVIWLKLVVRKMLLNDLSTESFKLVVSPHNMALINKEEARFMEGLSKVTQIQIDETLNDTTCILETSQGNIEYDVSQGLEKIMTEIRILQGIS